MSITPFLPAALPTAGAASTGGADGSADNGPGQTGTPEAFAALLAMLAGPVAPVAPVAASVTSASEVPGEVVSDEPNEVHLDTVPGSFLAPHLLDDRKGAAVLAPHLLDGRSATAVAAPVAAPGAAAVAVSAPQGVSVTEPSDLASPAVTSVVTDAGIADAGIAAGAVGAETGQAPDGQERATQQGADQPSALPLPTEGVAATGPMPATTTVEPSAEGIETTALRRVFPEVTKLATSGNGTHRLTMVLQPEHLGEVRVQLVVKDGAVRVSLTADAGNPASSQAVHRALASSAPELHRLIEMTGATDTRILVREPNGTTALTQSGHQTGDLSDTSAWGGGRDSSAAGGDGSGDGRFRRTGDAEPRRTAVNAPGRIDSPDPTTAGGRSRLLDQTL